MKEKLLLRLTPLLILAAGWGAIYATSQVNLTTQVKGILPQANGGTGKSSWTASRCVHTDGSGNLTTAAADCNAGGGTAAFAGPYPLENGIPDSTGLVFYSSVALTSPFINAHWEFDKANAVKDLSFRFRYPHSIPTGTAKVILGNISANDGTAGHTMTFKECDAQVSTIENPASYTCTATQLFTTTSTAYAPSDVTFVLNDTPTADKEVEIYIECTATSGLTNNVLLGGVYIEWQ